MSDAPVDSKQCKSCGGVFALDHYSKSPTNRDRLSTNCRECRRAYWASYKEKHGDRVLAAQEWRKAKRKEDIEASRQKWREYYAANKARMMANAKAWAKKNPDVVRASLKRSREMNRVSTNAAAAARESSKRARIRDCQTTWADREWEEFAIKEAYHLAALRSEATGVKHVVDHIVPLRGKTVCGLHCIANLRVITWAENASKGNKLIEAIL